MYELVYKSTVKTKLSDEALKSILEKSRDFNVKNNITGCLIYYNNSFLQILEGNKTIVRDLFSKILKDERHINVEVLDIYHSNKRYFQDWSMAYFNLNSKKDSENNMELFKTNIIAYSEIANKPTSAIETFWEDVKFHLESS